MVSTGSCYIFCFYIRKINSRNLLHITCCMWWPGALAAVNVSSPCPVSLRTLNIRNESRGHISRDVHVCVYHSSFGRVSKGRVTSSDCDCLHTFQQEFCLHSTARNQMQNTMKFCWQDFATVLDVLRKQ